MKMGISKVVEVVGSHSERDLELSGYFGRIVEFLKRLRTFKNTCLGKVFIEKEFSGRTSGGDFTWMVWKTNL